MVSYGVHTLFVVSGILSKERMGIRSYTFQLFFLKYQVGYTSYSENRLKWKEWTMSSGIGRVQTMYICTSNRKWRTQCLIWRGRERKILTGVLRSAHCTRQLGVLLLKSRLLNRENCVWTIFAIVWLYWHQQGCRRRSWTTIFTTVFFRKPTVTIGFSCHVH